MMQVFVIGLYNRGQQDEYVELEAAERCSLDGLMLFRYLNNEEGYAIQSQTRVFEFPETNLRKGNRVRVYTGFTKEKKVRTPEGITFNFSWNLDAPIWEGRHVAAHVVKYSESAGFMPDEPMADVISSHERGKLKESMPIFPEAILQALMEGRFSVLGEGGVNHPLKITGLNEEEQRFFDNRDSKGLIKYEEERIKAARKRARARK